MRFHLRDFTKRCKIGAGLVTESAAPIFCPHPPTPQEIGADIIQSELWPSVGANQFAITNSSGLLRSGHNFRVVTQIDRVETNLDQLTARQWRK
jgi:hypothetical protein